MSDSSDIEIKSALPMKKVKLPSSPTENMLKKSNEIRKPSTKEMITEALIELKNRKGVSLYAIKKYLTEKHNVDTDKINYIIKKNIKTGVEAGSIIQMKGVGASGSFKLAVVKKPEKKIKPKPEAAKEKSKTIKKQLEKPSKPKSSKEKPKKAKLDKKTDKKDKKIESKKSDMSKTEPEKVKAKKEKIPKKKIAKGLQTPAKKKAAMMKRKSIGSIIKPPKMKPKAKV